MSQIQIGNIYYFGYIIIALIVTVGAVKFLNKKSDKFRFWFIFGLIMTALFIHFAKIFIFPYTTLSQATSTHILTKVTFENICAVSTLIFPFLYFTKNNTLKDYMIMVGMASGILTFLFPVDVMASTFNDGQYIGPRGAFDLEVFRFYIAHYLLFLAPFLMMRYKMHKLSIRRAYRAPFILIAVLFLIFINELFLTAINWVPREQLFSSNHRNPSFIFGVSSNLEGLGLVIGIFVPAVFLVHPITGVSFYWPVIWLILPLIIYGTLFTLIFMVFYDTKETKKMFLKIFNISHQDEIELINNNLDAN